MTAEQLQKLRTIAQQGKKARQEKLKQAAAVMADLAQRRKELKEVRKLLDGIAD